MDSKTPLSYFNSVERENWLVSDFCRFAGVTKGELLAAAPGTELFCARMLLEAMYEEQFKRRGNSGDSLAMKLFGWGEKAEAAKGSDKPSLAAMLAEVAGEKF